MENKAYWSSRAALGGTAGSQDVIAAHLERMAIRAHIHDGQRVLDVGCGTGELALSISDMFDCDVWGIDVSSNMIVVANGRQPALAVCYHVHDIMTGPLHETFDTIITQRCIINCGDWPAQQQAIRNILAMLKPGGQYLMCECSANGLADVNAMRAGLGLPEIEQPWHNRYLDEDEVFVLAHTTYGVFMELYDGDGIEYPCSTYALLSRGVNAALARDAGVEPAYDSAINKLALTLPNIGQFGQQRLWIWHKLA
jgi:ubiquinone/menaquinone biosynthesis C-methylase UbiE